MTFMNLSGVAVQQLVNFYKVEPKQIFVVYDDADLPLGTVRIKPDGSSGGHNGVQSIIDSLGTEEFPRFRIGVSNQIRAERKVDAKDFVLGKFTKDEEKIVSNVISSVIENILTSVKAGAVQPTTYTI